MREDLFLVKPTKMKNQTRVGILERTSSAIGGGFRGGARIMREKGMLPLPSENWGLFMHPPKFFFSPFARAFFFVFWLLSLGHHVLHQCARAQKP